MADEDQPIPADEPTTPSGTPAKPRGAGFDDDEWQRRDLGPRPEVPNHGRRPVLMGIPILLIAIAAVVAILVAGCGGDDEPPASSGSPAASTAGNADASTDKVVALVRTSGAQLAGLGEASALADATCEPTDGADFRCAFGAEGDPDAGAMRIRLQDDGTITKILGTQPPVAGQKTSAQAMALLAADDATQGLAGSKYACATATAINPDGSSAGGSTTGQRCVLIRKGQDPRQRYVEFAPDGTARRDFAVSSQ